MQELSRTDLPESLTRLYELVARETEEITGWSLTKGGRLEIVFRPDGQFDVAYGHGRLTSRDSRLLGE